MSPSFCRFGELRLADGCFRCMIRFGGTSDHHAKHCSEVSHGSRGVSAHSSALGMDGEDDPPLSGSR